MPSSSAPARAIMPFTSGTFSMISRWISRSVSAATETLIVGCLRMVMTGVPSSITGMKVWPRREKAKPATTRPQTATPATMSGRSSARSSSGS